MRYLLFFLALPFCSGKHDKVSKPIELAIAPVGLTNVISYDSAKQKVVAARDSLRHIYLPAIDIESIFAEAVVNDLISHWYGTTWDFNGMTEKPKQGQIACGYFVSTLLRDAGFRVQRIKLAQSAASSIIKQVADKNTIRGFSNQPVSKVDSVVKKLGAGLYVAGLDYHVGFLYCNGQEVFFIHSNYIGREGVVKEPMLTSRAFANSKYRIIGKVSTKECLIKNWLN